MFIIKSTTPLRLRREYSSERPLVRYVAYDTSDNAYFLSMWETEAVRLADKDTAHKLFKNIEPMILDTVDIFDIDDFAVYEITYTEVDI